MPDAQALYARHRRPTGGLLPRMADVQPEVCLRVEAALASLAEVAARPSFEQSAIPVEDDVLAYALALMRLHDSAQAAGRTRLALACDALSVTVARLLEQCSAARCEPCAALRQFVVHAQAMLRLPVDHSESVHAH